MQIHFTSRNLDLTPALKTYVEEKMERLEKRHSHITTLHITLHVEKVEHTAEATAHTNGADIHASAKGDNMYSAVDLLVDKIITQVTKHKEKIIDQHR
jgi:putative sigma-54 modulation protein